MKVTLICLGLTAVLMAYVFHQVANDDGPPGFVCPEGAKKIFARGWRCEVPPVPTCSMEEFHENVKCLRGSTLVPKRKT